MSIQNGAPPQAEGGCLCGQLRYCVTLPPLDAGYCHCRICQRSAGAPVLAWATFPAEQLRFLTGHLSTYRSSPGAERGFCGTCGTQLFFRADAPPPRLDINLATLDRPELIAPDYHIWTASRIPWFETADSLPRHPDDGPDV